MQLAEYRRVSELSFLLVLSGADRVGKDWLAERLHKRLSATYVTLMKPMHLFDQDVGHGEEADGKAFDLHVAWLAAWRVQMLDLLFYYRDRSKTVPTRIIVDRLFPDEWAYAKAMGRNTYDDADMRNIDYHYYRAGARWLLCVESMDVIQSRWDDRASKLDIMAAVQSNFHAYREWTYMRTMVANTRETDVVERAAAWLTS